MTRALISDAMKEFVAAHLDRSPSEVALMTELPEGVSASFAAQQIKARQRLGAKLPSWVANSDVAFPLSLALEQCSSEAAARYKASLVGPGALAWDLTGGFGVDARFLAERFERVASWERDPALAEIAAWNARVFGIEARLDARAGDGAREMGLVGEIGPIGPIAPIGPKLHSSDAPDLIYLDPARRDARSLKVSAFDDCEPDAAALWPSLLARAGRAMLKASPGLDLARGLSQLSGVFAAHVVSVEGSCKELLFLGDRGFDGEAEIVCVDLGRGGAAASRFAFRLSEEAALEARVGPPERYLYEPNASILKGGAFKSVAARYGLAALHPRTRLYAAGSRIAGFPGRVFEIEDSGGLREKEARRLFPDGRANVVSRNSGLSAEELRRKLKLGDGGDGYAIGTTLADGSRRLFRCRLA